MQITISGMQAAGVTGDVAANLDRIAAAARLAKAQGAELLVTPEMFVTGYNLSAPDLDSLTTVDLPRRLAEVAQDADIAIVGGLPERLPDGIANTAVFVDSDGAELMRYRKTHLFGALDRRLFVAGDVLPAPVTFRGVRVSLLICYDVEFPETVRAAALAGAELVIVPTAQMEPYEFLAEQLVRVRAWENQLYVAYVNRSGAEGDLRYVGRTSIVGPSGEVLSALGGSGDEGLAVAVVDTELAASARARNPYLTDRRPELYHPIPSSPRPMSLAPSVNKAKGIPCPQVPPASPSPPFRSAVV